MNRTVYHYLEELIFISFIGVLLLCPVYAGTKFVLSFPIFPPKLSASLQQTLNQTTASSMALRPFSLTNLLFPNGSVLAAQDTFIATADAQLNINIPTLFNQPVKTANQNVDLGTGQLTASNVVYSVRAGNGIGIVGGQNPVISNTGVLSLGGQTGQLALTAGDGISIDGLKITNTGQGISSLAAGSGISVSGNTITNSDTGSSQKIFKTIAVSGQSDIVASSNTDTLTFVAGSGITLTTDPTTKAFTITGSGGSGSNAWSKTGTFVNLTTSTDTVGIGANSSQGKLAIVGTADQNQLFIKGYSSQATNIIDVQNSSNADLLTLDGSGNLSTSGSVNVATGMSYKLGGSTILTGNTNGNIFGGINAGIAGYNDTFLGYSAGHNNSSGAGNNTFIGNSAGSVNNGAQWNTFVGSFSGNQTTDGWLNTFIGASAGSSNTTGQYNVYLGDFSGYLANLNYSIAIGSFSRPTADHQLVIGSDDSTGYVTDGYFGNGVTKATPLDFTLHATGGSGSNNGGANLILASGQGTGFASGGSIIFKTSPAGFSGSSLNSLTEAMRITSAGSVGIGTSNPGHNILNVYGGTSKGISLDSTLISMGDINFDQNGTSFSIDDTNQDINMSSGFNSIDVNASGISMGTMVGINSTPPSFPLDVNVNAFSPGSIATIARFGLVDHNQLAGSGNRLFLSSDAAFDALTDTSGMSLAFETTNTSGSRSEKVRIDGNGNMGIGLTNPSEKLQIVGNLRTSGHMALGPDATVDQDDNGPTTKTLLNMRETFTSMSTDFIYGLHQYLVLNPSTAPISSVYGIDDIINTGFGNTRDFNNVNATDFVVNHAGTGIITNASAARGRVENFSSGTIGSAYGGYFQNRNTSTGTISNSYGSYIDTAENSGGGTVTNNYGLYLADQSGVGSSNSYNLYSAGSSSKNYFGGKVGIGSAPDINSLLTLNSSVTVQGSAPNPSSVLPALELSKTFSTGTKTAAYIQSIWNPSANASGIDGLDVYTQSAPGNSANLSNVLLGANILSEHMSSGTASSVYGAQIGGVNNGGGTATQTIGALIKSGALTGNVTTAYGLQATNYAWGATLTNSYSGVFTDVNVLAGTVANNVGVNITALTHGTNNTNLLIGTTSAPTGNYSIYSSSAYDSYLSGKLGIGNTSPTYKLDVTTSAYGIRVQTSNNLDQALVLDDLSDTGQIEFYAQANGGNDKLVIDPYSLFQVNHAGQDYLYIPTMGSGDAFINLLDAAGSNKFKVRDSNSANVFTVDSSGNMTLGTGTTLTAGHQIDTSSGAYLTTSGTWTNVSDRNVKENFTVLDASAVLDKITQLPITEWNYIKDGIGIKHIGPVAQDFYSLFGVGNNNTSISTIDPAGIALVGIQQLDKESHNLNDKYASVSAQLDTLTHQTIDLSQNPTFLTLADTVSHISTKVDNHETRIASLEAKLANDVLGIGTASAGLTGTDSATLSALTVTGHTNLNDLSVLGTINSGLLSIDGLHNGAVSINSLAAPLKIQDNLSANVDFMAGQVVIDTTGKITAKSITVKKVNVDESDASSASIGEATLTAGQTQLVIHTSAVTDHSKIFITPRTKVATPLSVTTQTAGDSFAVETTTPFTTDVKFDWWIVN